nr:hypothetical protein [uncultured Holophaga sp.]
MAGRALLSSLMVLLMASGCQQPVLDRYQGFARAGSASVKATASFIQASREAAIEADSAVLLRGREALDTEGRRQEVLAHDRALQKRLGLLGDLEKQGSLLQSYLDGLAALAASGEGDALSSSLKADCEALEALRPGLTEATLGSVRVGGLLEEATAPVVKAVQVRGLDRELKARSAHIHRELLLQEAALKALGLALSEDLALTLNLDETAGVVEPYAQATAALPSTWAARRKALLLKGVAARSAGDAAAQAALLRKSFEQLVEDRLAPGTLARLSEGAVDLEGLARQLRTAPEP